VRSRRAPPFSIGAVATDAIRAAPLTLPASGIVLALWIPRVSGVPDNSWSLAHVSCRPELDSVAKRSAVALQSALRGKGEGRQTVDPRPIWRSGPRQSEISDRQRSMQSILVTPTRCLGGRSA
jgi:hypothetical protein